MTNPTLPFQSLKTHRQKPLVKSIKACIFCPGWAQRHILSRVPFQPQQPCPHSLGVVDWTAFKTYFPVAWSELHAAHWRKTPTSSPGLPSPYSSCAGLQLPPALPRARPHHELIAHPGLCTVPLPWHWPAVSDPVHVIHPPVTICTSTFLNTLSIKFILEHIISITRVKI